MSFGGFSDIQRDRDRAHSSRHRNAEHEHGETGFSRWSAGIYRGPSETEEETEEESGHESGHEEQQPQQPPRKQRSPSPTGGNSYATNNPRGTALREATTNGAGVGVGGVNWGSAAETGIAQLAKAYDKSASANKEAAGSNGSGAGKSNVFGQRLAEREEPENGAGAVMVKQAFGSGECALSAPVSSVVVVV